MLFCCHPCCSHHNFCTSISFVRYATQAFLPENINPARCMATRQARKYFQEMDCVLQDQHASSSPTEMAKTASVAADAVSAI